MEGQPIKFIEVTIDGDPIWYNADEIIMMRDHPQTKLATVWLRDGTVVEWPHGNVYSLVGALGDTGTNQLYGFNQTIWMDTSSSYTTSTAFDSSTTRLDLRLG